MFDFRAVMHFAKEVKKHMCVETRPCLDDTCLGNMLITVAPPFVMIMIAFYFVCEIAFGIQASVMVSTWKVADLRNSTFNSTTNVTTNGTDCYADINYLNTYLVVFAVLFITHGILSLAYYFIDWFWGKNFDVMEQEVVSVGCCDMNVVARVFMPNEDISTMHAIFWMFNFVLLAFAVVAWLIYGITLVYGDHVKAERCIGSGTWNAFALMVQFMLYAPLAVIFAILLIPWLIDWDSDGKDPANTV